MRFSTIITIYLITALVSLRAYGQHLQAVDTLAEHQLKKVDSIQHSLDSKIKSETNRFNKSLDSLKNLGLSQEIYIRRLDSAYNAFQTNVLQRYRNGSDTIDLKTGRYLYMVDSTLTARTRTLDSLLQNNGLKHLNHEALTERLDLSIPGMPDTGISMPSLNKDISIPTIESPVIESPVALPDIPANDLKEIAGKPEELGALQEHVETLAAERGKVKEGDAVQMLEQRAEERVMNTNEMKELRTETKTVDALNDQVNTLKKVKNSPDSVKTMLKKKFVDHFAGKEEKVKMDLDNIARIQLKHKTFSDSRILSKRPPNEMKGKPFAERLIPGITFQVFTEDNVSVDIAPFIGYRFSGKFNAGIGGYKRITYFSESDHLKAVDCYGFRMFASHKVIRDFSAYSEIEYYQNYTKPAGNPRHTRVNSYHRWKWNFGMHKRYSMGKNFYGHFVAMYDLVKIKRFPNTEGAAVRFGVDYLIKKKKRE